MPNFPPEVFFKSFDAFESGRGSPPPRSGSIFSGVGAKRLFPHVLLVEDDPVSRWLVRTALLDECMLRTASTASRALDIVHESCPDLIILDIGLPDLDGFSLLKILRLRNPALSIVVLSSNISPERIEKALRWGAIGYITKPFKQSELIKYLPSSEGC